ncbi:TVB66 protein, partial [Grantiella picta]|nr:TVB66 protein [Grantiella picta]
SWSDPGLFFLSAAITGQVILEQNPREMIVREGDQVTFQCSMRGADMNKYYMYWYRQGPGGSLKFIYRRGGIYGEGFKDHFEGSLESSKNQFTL